MSYLRLVLIESDITTTLSKEMNVGYTYGTNAHKTLPGKLARFLVDRVPAFQMVKKVTSWWTRNLRIFGALKKRRIHLNS